MNDGDIEFDSEDEYLFEEGSVEGDDPSNDDESEDEVDSQDKVDNVIIGHDSGPSNRYVCALCGSNKIKIASKKRKIPKGCWIKNPLVVSRFLCGGGTGCYEKVRKLVTPEQNFLIVEGNGLSVHALSDILPGCINPVDQTYEISGVKGHSFQMVYKVGWEGYSSNDDTYLLAEDIDSEVVKEYQKKIFEPRLVKKLHRVVKNHSASIGKKRRK